MKYITLLRNFINLTQSITKGYKILNKFKKPLSDNTNMTNDEWKIIETKLKIVDYKKNEIILNIDDVCNKLRFVNKNI